MKSEITVRKIDINGKTYIYYLVYRAVKNINLSVKPDKTVYVSANKRVPLKEIDRFVEDKSVFILNAVKKLDKCKKISLKEDCLGGHVVIFDKLYKLEIKTGRGYNLSENTLTVFCKRQDKSLIDKYIEKSVEDIFISATLNFCNRFYPEFKGYCKEFPLIKCKKMKSRWGSCNYEKNILTFNKLLVKTPIECLKYVVIHEFCHFVFHNHSKSFYNKIASFMPDYKEKQKLLKEYILK